MHFLFLLLPLVTHAAIDPVVDAADRRLPESPAIARAAASVKPKIRVRAARAWGQIMSPKGIDGLFKLSRDQQPWVREEAAFALGQLGWLKESAGGREADIQARLSELLHDRQLKVRLAAAEALGKTAGDKAPDLLAPALAAEEASLRSLGVMALFRARMVLKLRDPEHPPGPLAEPVRKRLLELAEDRDSTVRLTVAYLFARTAEPLAEAAMAKLAHDPSPDVRLFAVTALGKMKARNSKPALEAALRDPDYAVRVAAVGAFAAAAESLAPYAPELQREKTFHVRAAAAAALDAKKPEELALLNAFLDDASPTVKAEALKAIAKAKNEALGPWLQEQARSAIWQVREAAVQSAEPLAQDAKEKFLRDLLAGETDRLVRAAALDAWFQLPTADAYAQLKKSLDSPELSERATAVGALSSRAEADAVEAAWKTYRNSLDPKWVETREDLLETFIKKPSDVTTGYLRGALEDPDRAVRAKARAALQSRGATDLPELPEPDLTFSPFRDDTFRRNPVVELKTNRGSFLVECFAQDAPVHVADFLGHVKAGFYDGLSWHRVVSNFVVQGGDPDGTGFGGAGYALRAEINRRAFTRGALGMPRSQGFDTGGGQLFFSIVPTPHLEGQYTVFGQVTSGFDVLERLERGDKILKARRVK